MVNGIGAACLRIPSMIVALGIDAAAQTPMAPHTGSFAPEQAAWADVAVCAHPENDRVRHLDEPVNGMNDIIAAFDSTTPATRLVVIKPAELVHDIVDAMDSWAGPAEAVAGNEWLRERESVSIATSSTPGRGNSSPCQP